MDQQYRNLFARYVLELAQAGTGQSAGKIIEDGGWGSNLKACIVISDNKIVGQGLAKDTGTKFYTSPVFESGIQYLSNKYTKSDITTIFCNYFPSLEELLFLSQTDIRRIYYMGDILDDRCIIFLNNSCYKDFEVIKLEIN